jgi:hypothetical protein
VTQLLEKIFCPNRIRIRPWAVVHLEAPRISNFK